MFREGGGGTLSRSSGFVLVALLLLYMIWSVRLARWERQLRPTKRSRAMTDR